MVRYGTIVRCTLPEVGIASIVCFLQLTTASQGSRVFLSSHFLNFKLGCCKIHMIARLPCDPVLSKLKSVLSYLIARIIVLIARWNRGYKTNSLKWTWRNNSSHCDVNQIENYLLTSPSLLLRPMLNIIFFAALVFTLAITCFKKFNTVPLTTAVLRIFIFLLVNLYPKNTCH